MIEQKCPLKYHDFTFLKKVIKTWIFLFLFSELLVASLVFATFTNITIQIHVYIPLVENRFMARATTYMIAHMFTYYSICKPKFDPQMFYIECLN